MPTKGGFSTTDSWSGSAPNKKEGRKLDILGCRHYSLASFILRVANYMAAMGTYQWHLWNKVLPLINIPPEEHHPKCSSCHQEAMTLAHQEHIAARHIVDAASKQIPTSIALCRHSWLRSVSIPDDVRNKTEDLPFDGNSLFDGKTDEILDNLQKMRKTARSYLEVLLAI